MHNLAQLLMQMERVESEVSSRLSGLQDKIVKGKAGEGLVVATGDTWFNILGIHIDREKLASQSYDLESLEKLIVEAVNNTIKEARKLLKTEIGGVLGGQFPPEFANFFGRSTKNGE